MELSGGVGVSSEGSVGDAGSVVHEVWHDWLVLRSIPRNVSGSSHSVSVTGLVVLMEDWSLSHSPLEMCVWHWWRLWQLSSESPPEQVWVVHECSLMELVVIEDDWSFVSETSSESSSHDKDQVCIHNPASHVEVLNWEFSNYSETKSAS